ncbi:hypothetical protein [Candidatus Poriferisodalis sp.]|uniref:hypothetical protein n=1 Tax=Candidatus Poriferisodalis sp. TaxID=3101277 RepID=UPI003B01409C
MAAGAEDGPAASFWVHIETGRLLEGIKTVKLTIKEFLCKLEAAGSGHEHKAKPLRMNAGRPGSVS